MSRAARYALLALVSVTAHLYGIASPPLDYHYHRQANTAAIARNYHADGLPFLRPRIDWAGADRGRAATEFPLYMWLVGAFWGLLGLEHVWGRLLSVLFSALTALTLFRFLEDWMEIEAAFYAGIFFSLLPVEVYFGRTIQPEALALLATLLTLLALDRYLTDSPRSLLWLALAAASAGTAIGSKLPYAYLLGVCAALAWARRRTAALQDPVLWLFFAAVPAAVAAWYLYARSGVYVVPTSSGAYLTQLDLPHWPYHAFYQIVSRFPELAATYAGVGLVGAGLWDLSKQQGRSRCFLPAWWVCVWAYVLGGGGYTFTHEYTALPFAPINAAFMGLGLAGLRRGACGLADGALRRRALAALSALLLAVPVHAALRIRHWYRINYPFLLELRPVVDRISAPDDLFLCNQTASSLYLYFIGRRGWSWDVAALGESRLGMVEKAAGKGARFFLTEKGRVFSDPGHPITRWFNGRYPIAYDGDGARIYRLSP